MVEQYFEQEPVRVACTVSFKTLSATSFLVATNARGVVRVDGLENVKPDKSYQAAVM